MLKISVLIGTRNRPEVVRRCIDSVMLQDYESLEVIVLDDASSPPMSYLPLTLIITLTSSLFVAIIINPVITGIFVKLDSEERKKPTRTARIVTAVTVAALGLILALTNINTFIVLA